MTARLRTTGRDSRDYDIMIVIYIIISRNRDFGYIYILIIVDRNYDYLDSIIRLFDTKILFWDEDLD